MVKLCLVSGMKEVIKDRGEERIGMTGKVGLFTKVKKRGKTFCRGNALPDSELRYGCCHVVIQV